MTREHRDGGNPIPTDRVCSGRERFPHDPDLIGDLQMRLLGDRAIAGWRRLIGAVEYIRPAQADDWDLDHDGIR
jgi:hypothetical protein